MVDPDRGETNQRLFFRALGPCCLQHVFLPGIGATMRYWEFVVGALALRRSCSLSVAANTIMAQTAGVSSSAMVHAHPQRAELRHQ